MTLANAAASTLALLLALAGCGSVGLSDTQILALQASTFDKRAKMGAHEVLGVQNRVRVVADYYCSDLCPQYTKRIIHLDVAAGPACVRAGGAEAAYIIPIGIAAAPKTFCIPRALEGKSQ